MQSISERIAAELNVNPRQVDAAVKLLDEGATVPFISRYRKEATEGLDDTQLRNLAERLQYLRELDERRQVVLKSISEQNKLTPELQAAIIVADTKVRLEDLYRPYMPKRRTKAQVAREAGLAPLAEMLLENPLLRPEEAALAYVNADRGVENVKAALEGARFILVEQFAEHPEAVTTLREFLWQQAKFKSVVVAGKEEEGAKFSDYFAAAEACRAIPSHRALALFRGRNEGVLQLTLVLQEGEQAELPAQDSILCEMTLAKIVGVENKSRAADNWLRDTVRWAWRTKLFTHLDTELKLRLREQAEAEAIKVFAKNLRDLLLAAPAGSRSTMGLDPGLRTGVKVAVVDNTGKLLDTATIYPHAPQNKWDQAIAVLAVLAHQHKVELISIGNGTASRETDALVVELIKKYPELNITKITVSEAGASVYSASEFAAKEFPELDVSLRGAVSIARRLQDPLAELVKIEPKAIGVGQYQHDVNQSQLATALEAVVEDCVNAVGVDVNTASAPLLSRVAGFNATVANNVVSFREKNGLFRSRSQLKKVPRLGEKVFEQSAGFLRIVNGENPLDASAVHPESYPVVERIISKSQRDLKQLIGDSAFLGSLKVKDFTDERFGEPTVRDILAELDKPGRDPRPEFRTATFREGVHELKHLSIGMELEGVVTNVTNFGAFVDIGVHQDGLVHVSALSNKFIKDPHEIVKAGDIVRVKVLEVDLKRRRISLTMRLQDQTPAVQETTAKSNSSKAHVKSKAKQADKPQLTNALAAAFEKLKSS